MNTSRSSGRFALLVVAALLPNLGFSESALAPEKAGNTASRPAATRSSTSKPTLPDPALLDGADLPVEKKSEYGMIGDFEMPGNENVRSGRVGGPQLEIPPLSIGGKKQVLGLPVGAGGGSPLSVSTTGGLPSVLPSPLGGASVGGQSGSAPGLPTPGLPGGGSPAGPENQNAAGKPLGGAGDPNARREGMQVGELGGGPGQQSDPNSGGAGDRPAPVAIGDKAMRIESGAASTAVVGAQPQVANANTQVYEKPTGTGGKGPTGTQGPNRAEKGRTMPAGL